MQGSAVVEILTLGRKHHVEVEHGPLEDNFPLQPVYQVVFNSFFAGNHVGNDRKPFQGPVPPFGAGIGLEVPGT